MTDFAVVIVGAGIAGASLAAELADTHSVLLLEKEAHPGYHSTGRSAAFWAESYGGPDVQPLTTASGPFLLQPPADFHDQPLMAVRGALHIGTCKDATSAQQLRADFARSGVRIDPVGVEVAANHIPGLKRDWSEALWEPDCCDIDVAALHQAYLRKAKRLGVQLLCNAELQNAAWQKGEWRAETARGTFTARMIVNAAGAWADNTAIMCGVSPLGVTPYRRTVVQLSTDPAAPKSLPLVIGLDGSFYFKPEAGGKIWLSPHDETACLPGDAAPEELDVALAIDRLQKVVDWKIVNVDHKWAGLRSFSPDRLPIIGRDAAVPQFFWFAGQGGFGIQTAPAAAQLAASLLTDNIMAPEGVISGTYSPQRFNEMR
jgi:D-arginine dehydrogenase